ncbi:hypothetical protein AX16_005889 [Volvariella volvacea WC 439]|nr:hypothetical protein AX16_005889 [Volvariella volvacea WC 439]
MSVPTREQHPFWSSSQSALHSQRQRAASDQNLRILQNALQSQINANAADIERHNGQVRATSQENKELREKNRKLGQENEMLRQQLRLSRMAAAVPIEQEKITRTRDGLAYHSTPPREDMSISVELSLSPKASHRDHILAALTNAGYPGAF